MSRPSFLWPLLFLYLWIIASWSDTVNAFLSGPSSWWWLSNQNNLHYQQKQKFGTPFLHQHHHKEEQDSPPPPPPPFASVESIQQKLVQYGLAWKQQQQQQQQQQPPPPARTEESENPNWTRVPGCVATMYVAASVVSKSGTVQLVGTCDAIVSRGLLALLADYLGRRSVAETLALDPNTIARRLGVESALSPGRNDGLANLLRVVQQQLITANEGDHPENTTFLATEASTISRETANKPTVALLLSGGVDSSVALRLLQHDGYNVTAFYLKIWLQDELAHLGECPWEDDVAICQEVCDQASVPLKIMSLQQEYHQKVMQHTIQEAAAGRTPNPDILCNSRVKFGCFLDSIDPQEYDFVASGHYAQLVRQRDDDDDDGDPKGSPVALVRAPDPVKDQSYFLCALDQSQLKRLLFPIGHLQKSEVRELADHFELPNRHRPDSQGLCFLGKIKFRDFLETHLGKQQGNIVDAVTGEIIGRHDGVWYHTVGQRKGIGQSLFPLATSQGPWYVVAKNPTENVLFASNQYDEEVFTQSRSEFHVENIHWIAGTPPPSLLAENISSSQLEKPSMKLWLKIRHGPRLVQGTLQITDDENGSGGIITLETKDGGLAPGQYAVFYTDDATCLGGGIISERHWSKFLLDTQKRSNIEASVS